MLPKLRINRTQFQNETAQGSRISRQPNTQLQAQLEKLTTIVAQLAETVQNGLLGQTSSRVVDQQASTDKQTVKDATEQRFKQVVFPVSIIGAGSPRQAEIKKFIADVCSHIFSLGFMYFEQGKLNEKKYRLFCCHNLLANIVRFAHVNKLSHQQIETIDDHLKNWVLVFLKSKYPQSESAQSNLKLSNMIVGIDNIAANFNDLIVKSKVKFEKKQSRDYSREIMKFLNYVINLTKEPVEGTKSLFNTYYQEMEEFFSKVDDEQWVLRAKQGIFNNTSSNKIQYGLQYEAKKQKYKQKVHEYTKYLIGKKISDNVSPYSESQIKAETFKAKSPGMMRILTKWCQELEKVFNTNQSIIQREQMFVMKDGTERYLSKQEKVLLASCLDEQKQFIKEYLKKVKTNIYENQQLIISSDVPQTIFRDFSSESESSVGFITSIMSKSNENYLINYLNKLIDCILTAQERWMDRMHHKSHYKQQIPSLITFKIGDLLRCKCSSKETQITALFSYLLRICQQSKGQLEMVRIKNRLSQGTKDILINLKYRGKILTQMQLSINEDKSNFIKCSDKANHFIYQLERASFGPLSQISNVCFNVDERSEFYSKTFERKNQWKKAAAQIQQNGRCLHKWQAYILPVWCSQCKKFNASVDLLAAHEKCIQCHYYKCSKCIIANGEVEEIPIIKNLNWQDYYNSFKLSSNKVAKLEVIDLEKKQLQTKNFVLFKLQGKTVVFEEDQQNQCFFIQRQIKTTKQSQTINKISTQKQIVRVSQLSPEQNVKLLKIAKDSLFQINLKNIYKNQGRIFVHQAAKIENQNIFNEFVIPSVNKISLMSTQMKAIGSIPTVFPNCQFAVLSFNAIENFKNLSKWKNLKVLHLQSNKLKHIDIQISGLQNLQTLNLRQNFIEQLDNKLCCLNSLKFLNLEKNKIKKISQDVKNLKNLEALWLKQNQIEEVPQQIGSLEKLKAIVLDQNNIKSLPSSMKKLTCLELLNLNDNKIEYLPDQLFIHMVNLQGLWVYRNQLKSIPSSIKHLIKLYRFSAFNNKLTQIPQYIGSMNTITYLNLSNNPLNSSEEFNKLKLTSVIELRLNESKLTSIPEPVYNMKHLKSLHIYQNPIKTISAQLGNLRKLEQLNVALCELTQLPNEITQLKNLKKLDFKGNKLSKLPYKFGTLAHLQKLDIQQNKFAIFPVQICEIQSLLQLHAGQNPFQTIPPEIGKLKRLRTLTISSDSLTHLPNEIERLQKLLYAQVNSKILDELSSKIFVKMFEKVWAKNKKLAQP